MVNQNRNSLEKRSTAGQLNNKDKEELYNMVKNRRINSHILRNKLRKTKDTRLWTSRPRFESWQGYFLVKFKY